MCDYNIYNMLHANFTSEGTAIHQLLLTHKNISHSCNVVNSCPTTSKNTILPKGAFFRSICYHNKF
jgi:uncharacterized Fe-S cluster-containing MiaB family protein